MSCCARCGRKVYHAECKVAQNKVYHTFCFSCCRCRKLLDSCSVNTCNGELYCNSCYKCFCNPCCTTNQQPCKRTCSPPSSCFRTVCNFCCKDPCCDPPRCDPPRCSPPRCNPPRCPPSRCKPLRPCSADPCCCTKCCETPCRPVRCLPCPDPCCTCCGKPDRCVDIPVIENFCLRPACPVKKCVPCKPCDEDCEPPTIMVRGSCCNTSPCNAPPCNTPPCNPCCPPPSPPKCCRPKCSACCRRQRPCSPPKCCQRPQSACAAPSPREISSYYSRNHNKCCLDDCKGPCYCPDDCCCSKKDPCPGPCPGPDCPPSPCCVKPAVCKPQSDTNCCATPFCPPPRKPVCYPPKKCCDPCPKERICYYPCQAPCQPPFCPCGLPNPCNCDLSMRRKCAIECNTPKCRRCGKKVYPAEKIMASCGAYHTCCFSCYCCHRFLEVTNVYECQGEIYCKRCYSAHFGIKGYGYGLALQSHI